MHAVTSKWQIEIVKPGSSLLLRKTLSKDPASLKEQFPAYIQAQESLIPSQKGGFSPPKDRATCSDGRVPAQGYAQIHSILTPEVALWP